MISVYVCSSLRAEVIAKVHPALDLLEQRGGVKFFRPKPGQESSLMEHVREDIREIDNCDELWLFGEYGKDCQFELGLATAARIPIRLFIDSSNIKGLEQDWMYRYASENGILRTHLLTLVLSNSEEFSRVVAEAEMIKNEITKAQDHKIPEPQFSTFEPSGMSAFSTEFPVLLDEFSAIQQEYHNLAVEKGFWDDYSHSTEDMKPSILAAKLALIHSEVSEALEEIRNGKPTLYYNPDSLKPEGLQPELADIFIRLLDFAELFGINLLEAAQQKHAYNKTRPKMHGGKKF